MSYAKVDLLELLSVIQDMTNPHQLVNASDLGRLEPETRFESLYPCVNTELLIDNAVLDSFLFKSFREPLKNKGIALMPTIRALDGVDIDQLIAIKSGENLKYTVNIHVSNNQIFPVLNENEPIVFEQPMDFVIWPIWVSNLHFGLFILSMDFNRAVELRGVYIEPFPERTLFESITNFPGSDLTSYWLVDYQSVIKSSVSDYILVNRVKPMIRHLGLEGERFDVVFLNQEIGTNHCSDYVIATIARLLSDDMDLSHHLKLLNHLEHAALSEAMVKKIRLLQINMFGPEYFRMQLPSIFSENDITTAMDLYSLITRDEPASTELNIIGHDEAIALIEDTDEALNVEDEYLEDKYVEDDVDELQSEQDSHVAPIYPSLFVSESISKAAKEEVIYPEEELQSVPVSPMSHQYPLFFSTESSKQPSKDMIQDFDGYLGDANIIDIGRPILLAEDPFGSSTMWMVHTYL